MLRVTIHEGRTRQVRKMADAIGHPVRTLKRVRIGPICDKTSARGSVPGADAGRSAAAEEVGETSKAATSPRGRTNAKTKRKERTENQAESGDEQRSQSASAFHRVFELVASSCSSEHSRRDHWISTSTPPTIPAATLYSHAPISVVDKPHADHSSIGKMITAADADRSPPNAVQRPPCPRRTRQPSRSARRCRRRRVRPWHRAVR